MNHHTDKHSSNDAPHQASGFFYRKDVIRWILRIFYACCAALVLVDFFIHRHTEINIEKIPGFYAVYGLVACVVLVLIAKWMRLFLIRDENFYDETEDSDDFLKKQGLTLPENHYSTNNSLIDETVVQENTGNDNTPDKESS